MGEWADEYVDSMIGGWRNTGRRRKTQRRFVSNPTCDKCGTMGYWVSTPAGWRIYLNDAPHPCVSKDRVGNIDFDNLTKGDDHGT